MAGHIGDSILPFPPFSAGGIPAQHPSKERFVTHFISRSLIVLMLPFMFLSPSLSAMAGTGDVKIGASVIVSAITILRQRSAIVAMLAGTVVLQVSPANQAEPVNARTSLSVCSQKTALPPSFRLDV